MVSYSSKILSLMFLGILLSLACARGTSAQGRGAAEDIDRIEARAAYIDGLAAYENENYREALELLKTAYVKLPDQAGVNFALADTYFMVNDLTNAEYYAKQAVKLKPGNLWYHMKLATIYREAGKNEAAVNELEAARRYHPRDTELLYELARIYADMGQPAKSNDVYNKLLLLEGEDVRIRLRKLRNFNNLSMPDSSLAELRKIKELNPKNISTLQALGNQYLKMNRHQKAKEVLREALQIKRNDSRTLVMLSDIYLSKAQWDSAAILLEDFAADSSASEEEKTRIGRYLYSEFNKSPNNTELRRLTGRVLRQLMKSEEKSGVIQELAGDFFAKTNQHELALEAAEKTTRLNPSNDSAWKQRLRLLLTEGKTKEAITVGKEAVEKIPQDPVILYFLGSAHLARQNYQQSIENLGEAKTLPVRRTLKSSILAALGDAHAGLEEWDAAFRNYEESLKITPRNAIVLNNYAYYLSIQKKALPKAKTMAEKALALDPGNSSYLDTLGWIHYQMGEYDKAEQYLRAALEKGSNSAEVMEHLGDILDKLNKGEQARKWWRKALEKDSTRTHLKNKISTQGE